MELNEELFTDYMSKPDLQELVARFISGCLSRNKLWVELRHGKLGFSDNFDGLFSQSRELEAEIKNQLAHLHYGH